MTWSNACFPPPCGYQGGMYSKASISDYSGEKGSGKNSASGDVKGNLNLDAANQLTDQMRQMFDEAAVKQFAINKMQTEGNLSIAAAKSRPNV